VIDIDDQKKAVSKLELEKLVKEFETQRIQASGGKL
jgi:hypothetical protein